MDEHDTRQRGNDNYVETAAEFLAAWVEAKKSEITVQHYWQGSGNKASVDQRQNCHARW